MYMETGIIRNNKVINSFDFYPNKNLDIYLRSHERGRGDDQWFAIANLTKEEVSTIKSLLETKEEKKSCYNTIGCCVACGCWLFGKSAWRNEICR